MPHPQQERSDEVYRILLEMSSDFGNLKDRLGRIEAISELTLQQASKTNGRVTSLEQKSNYSKGYLAGMISIVSFFSAIISLLLKPLFTKVLSGNT